MCEARVYNTHRPMRYGPTLYEIIFGGGACALCKNVRCTRRLVKIRSHRFVRHDTHALEFYRNVRSTRAFDNSFVDVWFDRKVFNGETAGNWTHRRHPFTCTRIFYFSLILRENFERAETRDHFHAKFTGILARTSRDARSRESR